MIQLIATRVQTRLAALAVGLTLVGACARTHLDDVPSDDTAVASREGDPSHLDSGRGPAASAQSRSGAAGAAASGGHLASAAAVGGDGFDAAAGNAGATASRDRSTAGGAAVGHTTAGQAAPSAPTSGAGGTTTSAVSGDITQLPIGIDVAQSAKLPQGLWVGQTRIEQACDSAGGGIVPGSSRRVTIQITRASGTALAQGSVVFGDRQELLPAPTDADQGYPANDEVDHGCWMIHPSAGYPYPIRDGHVSADGRFDFRIAIVERYGTWCGLQRSYHCTDDFVPGTETGYTCMPPEAQENFSVCASHPERCPIASVKFERCETAAICVCLENGCYANLNRSYRFNLSVDGETMSGVLVASSFDPMLAPIEIKLRKAE